MPKLTEGTFALGGLAFFAFWLFIYLPVLHPILTEKYQNQQSHAAQDHGPSGQRGTPSNAAPLQLLPENQKTSGHQDNPKENGGEFWSAKLTDWLLAAFTLALVIFTRRLYKATAGLFTETAGLREAAAEQSRDMKASIAAAQKAADAADRNARIAETALLSVEIPYLYPFVRKHGFITNFSRRSGQLGVTGFDFGNDFIKYYFRNFGRTPAEITEVQAILLPSTGQPHRMRVDRNVNPLSGHIVAADGGESQDFPYGFNKGMFDTYSKGTFSPDTHLFWFMGHVRYNDVFENEYVRGFCLAFSPMTGTFYPVGGEGYNYRKKTKSGGQSESGQPPQS